MSVEGLRVVRGPNWSHGNEDGGEGHVGTVTQDNLDDTLEVQWDMGKCGTYNSGKDGCLDLRILDSSPAGVKHTGIHCSSCGKKDFTGTRWRSSESDSVNLCTACYFADKLKPTQPFLRIDAPGLKGEPVPKRSASVKQSALGIYKDAEVKRGADWNYNDQDGGSGQIGIVQEVKAHTKDGGENNAVTVKWKHGRENSYRLGYRGKVDLECVEETSGTAYYRDHLFPLSTVNIPRATQPPSGSDSTPPPRPRPTSARPKPAFKIGEKVCIELPELHLKEKQRGHGGWSLRMKEYIGQHGVIQKIEDNGDCVISYDGKEFRFNKDAVRKVPSLKVGDVVRILDDVAKVQALQKRHGGWNPDMEQYLGKVGKVVKIDSDGDVAVGFGARAFVYNPACCEPAPGQKPMDERGGGGDEKREERPRQPPGASGGQGKDDGDGDDDADEAAEALANLVAQMFLLRQGAAASMMGPQVLVQAAANNDLAKVKELVAKDRTLVNKQVKGGLTALIISSHEGHFEVVKVLVANGADLQLTEDKGNNALMAALMKKRGDVAMFLIEKGTDLSKSNAFERNALHCAATNGTTACLKLLLQKGCDVNKQDDDGDTPLHDAITAKENTCVAFLLADSKINLRLCNKKGFSPLHFAALKDDDVTVEKILAKVPGLKDAKMRGGNTALHIAAINDNIATLKTLLKAGVNVNPLTEKQYTPLHLACHKGYVRSVELLVSNSADVKVVDEDGDTPLHDCMMATRQGQDPFAMLLGIRTTNSGELNERYQIACLLIKGGASTKVRNKKGQTPLEVCSFEKLRNAVKTFADKHERPSSGGGASGGSRGGVSLAELLGLPIPCMMCMEDMADARFLPCKHKVCCKQCAFRTRTCPACDQPIAERVDLQGRRIVMLPADPCKVQ